MFDEINRSLYSYIEEKRYKSSIFLFFIIHYPNLRSLYILFVFSEQQQQQQHTTETIKKSGDNNTNNNTLVSPSPQHESTILSGS
jgi:hypothetical protein